MSRYEICLSGSGGQGLILAGKILGQAIALNTDKNVVQTQSYGPEARGGASRSEVVVSDEPIYYPKVMKLDLLVALTQESCDKYTQNLKEGGILVVDPFQVKNIKENKFKVYSIPFTQISKNELGKTIYANIIVLGALSKITDFVKKDFLENTMLSHVPQSTKDSNKKAFERGYDEASRISI